LLYAEQKKYKKYYNYRIGADSRRLDRLYRFLFFQAKAETGKQAARIRAAIGTRTANQYPTARVKAAPREKKG